MKKTVSIFLAVLSVLVIILPLAVAFAVAVGTPSQNESSFVSALSDKCERLGTLEGERIVVVGGSSVAFGVNSEELMKYTGRPVVNFGLYAALGTKLMLDLSRPDIKEGDLVVIAPEVDSQTMSLYFNAKTTLKAMDGSFELLGRIPPDNIFSTLAASWDFGIEKLGYMKEGAPEVSGVYTSESFNTLGDISYERRENVMPLYYDPNTPIALSKDTPSDEFIEYLNSYAAYCKSRGADVVFSFSPMNALAVTEDSDPKAFSDYLRRVLDFELISEAEDYILDPGYFYDTNFHPNDAGMKRHTLNLARDILLYLGVPKLLEAPTKEYADTVFSDKDLVEISPPSLPMLDARYFGDDPNAKYFTYEQAKNGFLIITGLSELGKLERSLTLPLGAETYKVSELGEAALSGGVLEELIIPEGTNLRIMRNGAFSGAKTLKSIKIYHKTASDIVPPASFYGCSADLVVYVPEGSDYPSGYYWSERGLTFRKLN